MKKATTTGAAPKPAATRVLKPAPAKAAVKPTAAAAVKAPAPAPAPTPAPAPKKAGRVDSSPPRLATTVVAAKIDVGFGNLLYIRGDGPGLSWDRGVPMECASSDMWTWTTTTASRPFAYKVLINDERWSQGEDFVASAGKENTIWPEA